MGSAQGSVSTELEQARTAPDFGAHTPLSEKLLAVAIRAQNFTGSTGIAIALTEGQEMICRASWGTSAPEVGTRLSIEHSFTGLCVRTGEPLRCDDAERDPRVNPEACRALGISAIAAAPIRRAVKVIGVIAAFSDTPNAFTEKHLLILATLSEVIVELLDDPHPVRPLSEVVEADPDLGRAAAIAQPPVPSVMDRAAIATVVPEPAPGLAEVSPVAAAPDALVEDTGSALVEEFPAISQPPQWEPVSEVASSASTSADTAAPPVIPARRDSAAPRSPEVLPAAMDPGLLRYQLQSSTPTVSNKPVAELSAQPSATDTLPFTAFRDSTPHRRWLLPVAIVAVVALIGVAGWRWEAARKADTEKHVPVPLQQPGASAAQPEAVQETKAPAAVPAEPQHSPFSPPPITILSTPPKTKPAAELAADVTARRSPQPMIEAAGPVRRLHPTAGSSVAQAPETPAPQLALSAPDLPTVVARPTVAAVAAPVSRVFVAQLVRRIEPVYPEAARRLRISGKVVVKATITKAGTVGNVRWVSGNELFRDATVAAVKQWRYKPASLDGQPVESDLEIVLQFNRPSNQ